MMIPTSSWQLARNRLKAMEAGATASKRFIGLTGTETKMKNAGRASALPAFWFLGELEVEPQAELLPTRLRKESAGDTELAVS
jgi:hypothetical protein